MNKQIILISLFLCSCSTYKVERNNFESKDLNGLRVVSVGYDNYQKEINFNKEESCTTETIDTIIKNGNQVFVLKKELYDNYKGINKLQKNVLSLILSFFALDSKSSLTDEKVKKTYQEIGSLLDQVNKLKDKSDEVVLKFKKQEQFNDMNQYCYYRFKPNKDDIINECKKQSISIYFNDPYNQQLYFEGGMEYEAGYHYIQNGIIQSFFKLMEEMYQQKINEEDSQKAIQAIYDMQLKIQELNYTENSVDLFEKFNYRLLKSQEIQENCVKNKKNKK